MRPYRKFDQFVPASSKVGAADFLVDPVGSADFLVEAVGDGRLADSSNIFIKVDEKMK
jgi:hypothetical protein